MDDKFIQALHSELSSSYELGTVEEFGKKLASDDVFRKALFEDASKTLDLGDYATFEGQVKKKLSTEDYLPTFDNLSKSFQKRQKDKEPFSVVPPQTKQVKYEDTLPEDVTIEAVNKADKSRMDYLSGEAKKIEAGVIERVRQEATALSEKYEGAELEKKLDDLYELRSGEMQKAVETLAGETQYKYIDKDVTNYSDLFGNILDSNNAHGQKVQQIADLRQSILNSIPEEGRAVVKGELNRLISDLATQSPMGQQFLLKTSVATTRDKLIAAHDKLKAETDKKLQAAGIDPNAIATAPPMVEKEVDELSRLQGAIDFMNRALDVPESKEGAIGDAFKSELGNILTAGVSGLLESLEVMQSARRENPTEADKALVDAYGQLQQLQGMASENVDRYRRAKSLVGSIPYMEQFLLTGGVGDFASATARKVGESVLKKGIKKRIAQAAVKRLVEPVTEGAISMIGRVPIMPMTYKNIAEAGVALKEEDGKFVVDPAQMPTIGEAIGRGVYKSATDVFSESLGGVFALPKWKWVDKIITPSAKKLFTRVGMQNPFGEYGEEIFANLFQGEKIDRQFLGDLLMTIPIMTGGFAVLSTPAIISDLKMAKKKVPSAPEVEKLIRAKDEQGLLDLVTETVTGKTQAETLDIVEGVGAMVQENVMDEMTTPKVDSGASDIAPRIEGKTESGTQVSPEGDMPTLTTPSELNTGEIQGDVIPVKRISELREQSHTKGVFADETGKLYKSVEIKGGETMEHEVIAQNQDLSIMPAVGNIRNTSEGRAFEIERLSPLEEGDNITLDEYRAIVADAKKLDDRNIFVSESPDLARDKNGAVKLLDFSMSRNKAKAEKGDTNYSSEVLIASDAYDHLSQNDKNVISHENEIGRKNKLNKITKKDTPVETKGFLYSLTARPFSKGTFPEDGFVTLVSENDKKKDGSFGVMEFKRPLSQREVDKYELRFDGRSENSYPAPQTQAEEPRGTIAETAQVENTSGNIRQEIGGASATPTVSPVEHPATSGKKPEMSTEREQEAKVEQTAKDIARENLKAKWDNLKNIGVAYDPRSQAKAQVEFTEALLEYIKQEVLDTVAKIKAEVKDMLGHELSDADAEYLLAQSKGEAPPVEPPTADTTEQPEGKEYERRTIQKYRDESILSPEFKEWIGKHNITSTRIPNSVSEQEMEYIIATNGMDKAAVMMKDMGNNMPEAVRVMMGVRLSKIYDDLANAAQASGDLEGGNMYRIKALDIAMWMDEKSHGMATGLQALGSTMVLSVLSPKTLVMKAEREARRQRDKQLGKSKSDIAGKKKIIEKAQEEAIDELGKTDGYNKAKKKVTGRDSAPRKSVPKEKLAEEQKFRATKWDELRKAREAAKERGKSVGFAATPLHADEVAIAGEIARSYVRSGYYRIQDIARKLQREWKKFMGEDLDYDTAVELIPKETDGKPTEELMGENYIEKAADTLTKRVMRMLADPKTKKDDPIKLMVNTLFAKIKEGDTKKKTPVKQSEAEKIKEAILKKKEYAAVWEEAKELVTFQINSNEALSDEQKADYTERLQKFYDEVIGEPFSQKQVEKVVKETMADLDIKIDEIVKQHYTVYDATRRTLQEKLVDDLGLSEEDAQMFADAVGREFDKIATAKKKAALLRGIKPKETVHPKQAKATWEKLIELSNMGAWSDAEFSEAYAEKWGMPALTEEQAKAIEAFAKLVQETPEGYKKFERTQDMLAYIAKLNGMDVGDVGMALWYASILSGPRTQFKNVFANMANTLFEFVVSARRPQFIKALIYGLGTGWGHGAREAFHILYSGYSPIRMGKIEVPMVLEQWKFKGRGYNPLNWGKYVARVMMAADAFSYHGLKEMRAWELAMLEARKEDVKAQHPSKKQWAIATELLYRTSDRKAEAMAKAEAEGLKSRSNEYWRRVWEIMEKSRPLQVEEETNHFASRGTFNHAPEGTMGLLTDAISHFTQNVAKLSFTIPFTQKDVTVRPLKFVIPFTRIISNVANTAIDYTPYGFIRAKSGGIGFISYEDSVRTAKYRREYTPDEKGREYAKATIGLIAMTGLYILSGDSDDDDREPIITITANGTGDYRKNYELKEKGWQAYSIKIRGTKRWFSYQYTPLFLALAPIGYLRDIEKYHKEDAETMKWTDTLEAIVSQTMSAMSDMSWMASAAGLMEALSSNDIKTFDRWWQNMAMSTGKSVMYPKLAEQIVQMIDNATMNPRKDATGLTGKMLKDIPIARKGYNDMLNAVGEPIMYDPYMMIEKETTDPFWNYVVKNNAWIGKPTQKATMVFDGEVERGLTDDEYYQYIRLSGQAIRNRIENEVMTKELPQEEVVRAVNSIKTEERKRAREMMFGWSGLRTEYPEAWAFLTKNNLLPTRSTVKINDQTLTDPKLVDEYWDEVEVQFAKFMKNRKDVTLSPAARARWKDEINGESGLWGKAQKVVDSKWRTKTLSQIE